MVRLIALRAYPMRQVEYAKVAVSENGGGLWGVEEAVCVVSILSR